MSYQNLRRPLSALGLLACLAAGGTAVGLQAPTTAGLEGARSRKPIFDEGGMVILLDPTAPGSMVNKRNISIHIDPNGVRFSTDQVRSP